MTQKNKIKVAVIGYGYWGPNLVRNFTLADNSTVVMVCDSRKERLSALSRLYPSIKTCTDVADVFSDKSTDAVIIATPVLTHYDLAKKALEAGKHVLVEKPMTTDSKQALELIELAERKGLLLMVDHTFLYTGAVKKMKNLVSEGTIGQIKYFDSTRINLGLFQSDINVLWDLAPHDISILNFLIKDRPYSVNATGISHTRNKIENIAYLTLNYESGLIAHFNCSWSSPVKIRMMLIGGDKKMMVYNDIEPTEKIRVYDTGYDYQTDEEKSKILVDYRAGDIYVPKIDQHEALSELAADFVKCAITGSRPVSDNKSALDVIKILEAAQESIRQNGKEIIVNKQYGNSEY